MIKWINASSGNMEQLVLMDEVAVVKKSGSIVTLVLKNGQTYNWQWDGKSTTWAKFVAAMELSNAI